MNLKGGGPQGGKQPKMDFKGKPMGYFENKRGSSARPIVQLAVMPKGPQKSNLEKMPKVHERNFKKIAESMRNRRK